MVSYLLLRPATERILMTSAHIPTSGEPGPDEILAALEAALEEAIREDPGLQKGPPEDVSRDLARGGYLEKEPFPTLVAEKPEALERGER
jgi:hypothetical protein